MEYVVIGGDERFAWLARLLRERGAEAASILREKGNDAAGEIKMLRSAKRVIVNDPPRLSGDAMSLEALLELLPGNARVYACGPKHPPEDRRIVDLWAEEALAIQNAALTAEGALASVMRASSRALRGMRCMVVGWGRIGRALTELLVALGATVTVATRSEANGNRAVERGAEAVSVGRIAGALPGQRLIFNTAPAMVLDEQALRRVDRDAMLIDLASPPYGIDLHAAWGRGLRAWREPALPGRYCPESAALALLEALERYEGGVLKHD